MDKVPSYSERTDAAHLRLVAALDPQTVQERVLVDWLRQALDLSHLERLASMVERARRDVWPR
jgi:energy-converting hydrogenase A subunit M